MIITGCQRSGTMSIAKILGLAHEKHYSYTNNTYHDVNEVSWMAVPFVRSHRGKPIVHLVRHPLNVIRSLLGIKFFPSEPTGFSDGHQEYRNFLYKHLPSLKNLIPIVAAITYYLEWNKLLQGFPRIRIEDIVNAPRLNKRPRVDLTWKGLQERSLNSHLVDQLTHMAEDYGYATN